MNLQYNDMMHQTSYPKLGEGPVDEKVKNVWMFPDIKKSFPEIVYENEVVINPYRYYITSGEALRKTEILIVDIREIINNTSDVGLLTKLSDLLLDVDEFYGLLIETKGPSKYLEVTKCEDGIYSGNICARKDPKKKKK